MPIASVVACGILVVLALVSGSAGFATPANSSMLTVVYTGSTTFQVTLAGGGVVETGTVIPAGSYTVTVDDDVNSGDSNPEFTITGPGVDFANNLNSTGMGIDDVSNFGPFIFQTSSSYSIEDTNIGASSLITFTTTATSSASGGSNPSESSSSTSVTTPASGSPGGSASNKSSTVSSSTTETGAGSGASDTKTATIPGVLKATISAAGTPTLIFDGTAVKTLKPGIYTLSVEDHSRSARFILGHGTTHTLTLDRSTRLPTAITLSTGKWFVESSTGGRVPFVVAK